MNTTIIRQIDSRLNFANLINENNFKIICECGVGTGLFSKYLLDNCPNVEKDYLIEPFQEAPGWGGIKLEIVQENLKNYIPNKCEIIVGYSPKEFERFEDESFDFIYVDGDHTTEGAKKDLDITFRKLKRGGILAGHDYNGPWTSVKNVVDEFVLTNNLKLFITGISGNDFDEKYGSEHNVASWYLLKD